MIRLVGIEVRRSLARRATRVLFALAALLIAIAAVIVFFVSRPTFDRAAAERQGLIQRQANFNACLTDPHVTPNPREGRTKIDLCNDIVGPVSAYVQDKRYHLARLWGPRDPVLGGLSPILMMLALVAGASLLGGEWRHGTIGTLLTWEPRRVRVVGAKLVAVAIVVFAAALVLQALLLGALTPAALWRGTTEGLTAMWWRGLLGGMLRIGAVAAALAVFSASIASLGRNTAAAIGVAFGYLFIGENAVRVLRPKWQPWLIGNNGATVVLGHRIGLEHAFGLCGAVLLLGLYLAAVVAVTTASFVRRDVT